MSIEIEEEPTALEALSLRCAAELRAMFERLFTGPATPAEAEAVLCTMLGNVVNIWPKAGLSKAELHKQVDDAWGDLAEIPTLTTDEEKNRYAEHTGQLFKRIVEHELGLYVDHRPSLVAARMIIGSVTLGLAIGMFRWGGMKLEEALEYMMKGWHQIEAPPSDDVDDDATPEATDPDSIKLT